MKAVSRGEHQFSQPAASYISGIRIAGVGVERERVPERELPWVVRMDGIVEELNDKGTGLLLIVDEVNPSCEELKRLVAAYQEISGAGRDIALLLAGLPSKVSSLLVDSDVSFIRRAFQRTLEPIEQFDVEESLLFTFTENGREITDEAIEIVAEATGGFAYAIQLAGYYLWRSHTGEGPISADNARAVLPKMRYEMERSVFIPTLQELTLRELEYLEAMAVDEGTSSTSEVARRMGVSLTNASNIRRRLCEYGLIRDVRMGTVAFDMPLLRDHLASKMS